MRQFASKASSAAAGAGLSAAPRAQGNALHSSDHCGRPSLLTRRRLPVVAKTVMPGSTAAFPELGRWSVLEKRQRDSRQLPQYPTRTLLRIL